MEKHKQIIAKNKKKKNKLAFKKSEQQTALVLVNAEVAVLKTK